MPPKILPEKTLTLKNPFNYNPNVSLKGCIRVLGALYGLYQHQTESDHKEVIPCP
jgi:hypothetical protein